MIFNVPPYLFTSVVVGAAVLVGVAEGTELVVWEGEDVGAGVVVVDVLPQPMNIETLTSKTTSTISNRFIYFPSPITFCDYHPGTFTINASYFLWCN